MKLLFYDMQMPDLLRDKGDATGGACVRQYSISKGLLALGHDVGILTWKGANAYVGKEVDVDLVESYKRKGGLPIIRVFNRYFLGMYNAIKRYQPDFVLKKAVSQNNGILAFAASVQNVPFVYLVANDKDADDRYKKTQSKSIQRSYEYSLKKAELIICQNNYQLEKLREKFPDKKYMLMHNPFHIDGQLPIIKKKSERSYLAWIGIFSDQKNMPALLDIAKKMPEMEIRIAGTKTKGQSKEVNDAIEGLKQCENVRLVGFLKRTEVIPFLSEAYALFNTSHFEGFSNTFLESFAAGTPVVTRKDIDPDGLLTNNRVGVTVDDYKDLPEAMRKLMRDPKYNEITSHCREYLIENHDPKKLSQKSLMDCSY